MKNWHPVSVVVLILTGTIGIGMVYGMVMPLVSGKELSPDMQKTIDSIYNSAMAIVTLYVGAMVQRNKDKD
jgi:hypothetical protein